MNSSYGYILIAVVFAWIICVYYVLSTHQNCPQCSESETGNTCEVVKPIPPLQHRRDLSVVLQNEDMRVGVELGVFRGDFSEYTLSVWSKCSQYVLVDYWDHQENYHDTSNLDTSQHMSNKQIALSRLEKFRHRTQIEVCQNFTTVCVHKYPDNYFDFIYVDARHDYKGVLVDLNEWWPKLKKGGIFAGHDYVIQTDGPQQSKQNWTINYDGTVDTTGRVVKGAVDDFAAMHNRQVLVTYRDKFYNTWFMRK